MHARRVSPVPCNIYSRRRISSSWGTASGGGVAGKSIPVTWEWEAGGMHAIADAAKYVTGTGLLFLTRSDNGWVLLPVMQRATGFQDTYFPEPPGPIASAYSYAPGASPVDAACFRNGRGDRERRLAARVASDIFTTERWINSTLRDPGAVPALGGFHRDVPAGPGVGGADSCG